MLHRMMAILVLTAATLAAGTARADRKAEADKLAEAGEILFEAGKYADALRQFLDAYQRFEPPGFVIPEVIWNIARCYEELGDDVQALHYFEEFRNAAKGSGYRAKAEARIAELRERRRATLTIVVEPEGTRILVDGRAMGEAPLREPVRLDPGEHTVTLSRSGYRERQETVVLKEREARTLRVALERRTGTLRVVGVGGPATGPVRVLVDGLEVHKGYLPALVEVAAGQRAVKVEGPEGTEPVVRYMDVPDQGEVEVTKAFPVAKPAVAPAPSTPEPTPALAPAPATPAPTQSVAVTSRPGTRFPWHFVAIGCGAAVLVGGGVMTALAAQDRSRVTGANTWSDGTVRGITQTSAASYASSAKTKDTASYVLYGVGGAAVVGGVLWWVLGHNRANGKTATLPMASVLPVEGGAVIGAAGHF